MEQIGRYNIIRELGRGGMATVFLAEDPHFKRQVAIKVLPAQFTHDPQFRVRFEREARTIAALEHPAIVPVYDFGEYNNAPYLVMRNMSGGSLADRIEKGAMSVNDVLAVVRRIASALEAAHSKGIIHRDIKPANILFDQYNNAYLADFGIVKIAESKMTGTGIIGSPAYMSPEQAQGNDEIDGRSDIYALGIIIFEMLTGEAPYKGDTPVKQLMQRLTEPVPRITRVKPDLPPAIEPVVDKALARNPQQRYSTASDLARDFARITTMPSQPTRTQLDNRTLFEPPNERTIIERPPTQQPISRVGGNAGISPTSSQVQHTPITNTNATQKRRIPVWLMAVGGVIGLLLCAGIIYGGFQAVNGLVGTASTATAPATQVVVVENTPIPTQTTPLEATATDAPTRVSNTPTPIPSTIVPATATPTAVPIAGNVTVWHSFPDQERTAFNAIVNEFQAQYPAINFNAEFIPFDAIRETYETASANGNAPSIILGPLDWSAIFLEAGYTQDVSDLVSGATWAALRPVVVTNVQYKGQAVGVPFAAKGIVMYRNLNQIRVAPSTFEQVIALSPDYDFERGLYYSGGTLEALGGQLMDADGNPTFNNATGVEWVERVNQFNDPQNYGDNDINAFIAGDVSLIIDGTWNLQRIVNGAGTQNVEINALPIGSAGFTLSDLAMLSANVNQADIAANIAFMEFMASDEAQSILTVVGGRVPARTDTRIPSEHLRQAAIALDKGARFPIEPEMEAYWGPLTVALDNAYNGADPAQELQRAADEILTELGR